MYVDWEYYKIFYYVAKYQNFTKAARVLGNNQPNITHSMNRLESQLNCVLFIRSNRGVTLTPEGEMLYSRIASAAVQIQDAEEELSASATLEHGTISISATETALNIYLSEKLRAFHNNFPGIRLRISNHSTPQAVQAVKNGEVDFAIVSTPAEVDPGLKMVELKSFYEVLVGGKTFTALASQNLSLKELTNYPLISPGNHGHTVGGKTHVVVFGVKIIDGLDQADAADLKQVVHVLTAADEFLDHGQHQPEVAGNELLACVSVAVLCADEQCPAGVTAQDLQLGRVDTADLDFSKHKKFLPSGTP